MRRRALVLGRRGVTLVELMIAVTFMAVVSLATARAYMMTIKALSMSKGASTAIRLAQDKFETLQGLSYPLLLLTPQTDLDTPPGVDLTNYPPETFNMSGKIFTRSVIVRTAYRNASNNIILLTPDATDTGLKQISVIVSYSQGGTAITKTSTLLVSDPHVVPLDGLIYGVVTDTAGLALSNAKVFVTQNQNWTTQSSSTGYYQIPTDTATYTVTAIKAGYFDKESASVTPVGGTHVDMLMTNRNRGRITGTITARPQYLLISGVYAGLSNSTTQFVELYNPTLAPIVISQSAAAPQIIIANCANDNTVSTRSFSFGAATSFPVSIPSQGYFLISTTSPTINGVTPDALFPVSPTPLKSSDKGGVAIQDAFGVAQDSVGWDNTGGNGVANCREGTPVSVSAGTFGANGILLRKTTPTGGTAGYGSSFDDGNNSNDLTLSAVPAGTPRTSATASVAAAYGIPASSASVLATDGFSAGAIASATGYYLLSAIATGTWSVASFWTSYSSLTPGNIAVNTSATTNLDLLLEASASGQGGVAGNVLRADTLAGVSGITVKAGTKSSVTDADGSYILSLSSGSYTIEANPGYGNVSYDMWTATVAVTSGSIRSGFDFNLNPAGKVTGKVTVNGTSPYPGVSVSAVNSLLTVTTAVSDSLGNYALYGIPLGPVTISPNLNPSSQSSTPPSRSLTMSPIGTTLTGNDFTVTSSLGVISGTVQAGTNAITTGVLVIATTATFSTPPTIDNAYRTGANVLYNTISDSSGNYAVTVVKNSTYTVYAYYVQLNGTAATSSTPLSQSVYISSNVKVGFRW